MLGNAHYSVLWGFQGQGQTRSVLAFYNICNLKLKLKHRYNYTDSALMG